MSQQPDAPEFFGYTAGYRIAKGADFVRIGEREVVPERFTARMDTLGPPPVVVELEIEVEVDGPPRCRRFTVEAPEGGEVTTRLIQSVPVRHLVRDATAGAMQKVEPGPRGEIRLAEMTAEDVADLRKRLEGHRARVHHTRHSDERLAKVAKIYREASRAPTQAVADALGYSRAHAGRLVMEARRRKNPQTGKPFLGKARRGQAGEANDGGRK